PGRMDQRGRRLSEPRRAIRRHRGRPAVAPSRGGNRLTARRKYVVPEKKHYKTFDSPAVPSHHATAPANQGLFSKSCPKRLKPTSRAASRRSSLTGRSTRLRLERSRPEGRGSLGSQPFPHAQHA